MNRQPVVADVALDTMLECLDSNGHIHQIDTVLGYNRQDGYAMTMTFMTGDEPLTWTFARDLMVTGMHAPVGDGDVRIAPSISHGRAVVLITLSSPDGSLLLEARSDEVAQFIESTLDLVPLGSENVYLELDELITQILS